MCSRRSTSINGLALAEHAYSDADDVTAKAWLFLRFSWSTGLFVYFIMKKCTCRKWCKCPSTSTDFTLVV